MQTNRAMIFDHPSWGELPEAIKKLIEQELSADSPIRTWPKFAEFIEQDDWSDQADELENQLMFWLRRKNSAFRELEEAMEELEDHEDDAIAAEASRLWSAMVGHLAAPTYWKINGDPEAEPNLSYAQRLVVEANGNSSDRLSGWADYHRQALLSFFKANGLNLEEWSSDDLELTPEEINQRDELINALESSAWLYYTPTEFFKPENKNIGRKLLLDTTTFVIEHGMAMFEHEILAEINELGDLALLEK